MSEVAAGPINLDAEQALLGALLVNDHAVDQVQRIVEPQHFSEPLHGRIYEVILELTTAGRTAKPQIVRDFLPDDLKVGKLSRDQYLARLAAGATTVINAPDFARTVRDLWLRRGLAIVGEEMAAIARDPPKELATAAAQIEDAETRLSQLREEGHVERSRGMAFHVEASIEAMTKAYKDNVPIGIEWCLPEIERVVDARMEPGDLTGLLGASGDGKGQPLDAPVLTPYGFRPMGEIKVGSAVTSPDGSVSKVIGIYPLGERDIFKVNFHDGTSVEVTDDHLWLAWRSTGRSRKSRNERQIGRAGSRIYTTQQLIDALACRPNENFKIPVCSPVPFIGSGALPSRKPIPPYTLGALLGDGCFRSATISITSADPEIIERIEVELGVDLIERKHKAKTKATVFAFPHECGVRSALELFGLYNKRSENKFIPSTYLQMSIEGRWELLRGLMDTDGWVNVNGDPRFLTKSPQLADDVAWLARSLGAVVTRRIKSSWYSKNGGARVPCGDVHELRIKLANGADAFWLERKKAKTNRPQSLHRKIVSIEFSRRAQAQCIRVNHPSSLYLTNDFVVTHNTAFCIQQARFTAEQGVPVFVLSGEQSVQQCLRQMSAQRILVPAKDIKNGRLNENEAMRFIEDQRAIKALPLEIETWSDSRVAQLVARIRAFDRRCGRGLVIIDHAKKIVPDHRGDILAQQIIQIYYGLKNVAMATGSTILLLMQRNSDFLNRKIQRPVKGDAYGGEGTLQALDTCFAIYRPSKWMKERAKLEDRDNVRRDLLGAAAALDDAAGSNHKHDGVSMAHAYCLKSRFGDDGLPRQELRFEGRFTRFVQMPGVAAQQEMAEML